MIENYTQMVNDRCFDMVDNGLITVWNEIENTPEDTDAERWRKKLEQIANDFAFSSRFALVRILCARSTGASLDADLPAEGFSWEADGQTFTFGDVSCEHIASLDQSELSGLERALFQIADSRQDDASLSRRLIPRALRDSSSVPADFTEPPEQAGAGRPPAGKKKEAALRKESKTLLTRQEAMQLGHVLGLSFQEMSWFLLRVFDFEDVFLYHSSSDLIDAFGFLTGASEEKVEQIKKAFADRRPGEDGTAPDRTAANWTRIVSSSLPRLVQMWEARPEPSEELFLQWLEAQSPYLDRPSATATGLYRRLAAFSVRMIEETGGAADRPDFFDVLLEACAGHGADRADPLPDVPPADCGRTAAVLLEKNKELFTAAPDRAKAWRTVTVSANGLPRLIMAGRPDAGRSRVQDLLRGTLQVEKGDMLHLLWFAFNLFWLHHPIYTPNDIFNALADFTEAAQTILSSALLPPFYPPHIMEQSMMLSIVLSGTETGVPADVYAEICESLIMPRNRSK